MEFKCLRVPLNQVDIDNVVYRISTKAVDPLLVQSIAALGVINPPILISSGQRFIVIAGFARIDACRQIGKQEIHCHLIRPEAGPGLCARIAIIDNAIHRELNLMEQANAVRLLTQVYTNDDQLVQVARECGLSVNRDMVHKLLKVVQMPQALQQAVTEGSIALPVALQLNEMDDELQIDALIQLLLELRLGLNRQREILDWVVAIVRRDGISIVELLKLYDLQQVRTDSEMDQRQKGRMIRQLIKKKRYPSITRHEEQYVQTVRSLKLNKGTHLLEPPHFEGQTYSLKFDFQNYDELLDKHKEFSQLIKSHAIKDLWIDKPA